MVPDIAGTGHSFKGALSYYLHDKRENEQAPHLSSNERVAWTETRNLATDDVRTAGRIMIGTAKQANELKREAGLKNTGRQSNAHVYAYSLSWHPSEKPTREDMTRAADDSLKALGAENRQAVIICHTDRDHPHVHVVVNRVGDDGRMLSTSHHKRKISDWARVYEQERGQIFTPKRVERHERRQAHPDRDERREYAQKARITAQERAHDRKSQIGNLKDISQGQKERHRDQFHRLSERNKTQRDNIYRVHGARIKDASARHKAECKPIWAKHYREWRGAAQNFQNRETSLGGVVRNAWETAKHQRNTGQLGDRSVLHATVRNVFSSKAREQAFNEAKNMDRKELSQRLNNIIDREVKEIQAERKVDLQNQRESFQKECAGLIERQNGERAHLSKAWASIRPERGQGARDERAGSQQVRESVFDRLERKDRTEREPSREQPRESFFDRTERLERQDRERARDPKRDMDRDR